MIRAIITGATGMVGEGVLHECLLDADVAEVLIINRRPSGIVHPKLKEIVHNDFFDLSPIANQLKGYNACFFCLGVSSIGLNEEQFYRSTYILTIHMADILVEKNPDMTFCYVSGAGTDNSEKGRMMWARVKGKTENDLVKLPFKAVYNFRPGVIIPTKGLKNTLKAYKYFGWLMWLMHKFTPAYICSLKEIGQAMINSVKKGYKKQVLEVRDIVELAK